MHKNILYILADDKLSGSTVSFLSLIDEIKCEEIKPIVVVNGSGPIFYELKKRGVKCIDVRFDFFIWPSNKSLLRLFLYPLFFLRFLLFNLWGFLRICKIIKKYYINIVHTNSGAISVGFFAAKSCGVKHLWHIREFQDLDFGFRFFPTKKKFIKRMEKSDALIFVSKAVKENFSPISKGDVIYNGVSNRSLLDISKKEKVILFAGRLSEEKCFFEALDTFVRMSIKGRIPDNYIFKAVGSFVSEDYKSKVFNLLEKCSEDIRDKIKILGQVENVFSIMETAEIFLMTSKNEAFGRVTAEAMYAGCLIVARRSGGSVELLTEDGEELAIFFSSNDDLENAITSSINISSKKYLENINKCFEKAKSNFSNEEYGANVMKVYDSI